MKLIFGGSRTTRIIGGGVEVNKKKPIQLFRMDSGQQSLFHGNRAGNGARPKGNEIAVWNDGLLKNGFHFQVMKYM